MAKSAAGKRSVALIITGVAVLALATLLKVGRSGAITGLVLDLLQVGGIIVALVGFGVPWTKK